MERSSSFECVSTECSRISARISLPSSRATLPRTDEVSKARILGIKPGGIIIDNRRNGIIYCSFFIYKDLCPGAAREE